MTESIAQDGTQVDDRLVHPVEAGPTDAEADEEAPRRELSQERQLSYLRAFRGRANLFVDADSAFMLDGCIVAHAP